MNTQANQHPHADLMLLFAQDAKRTRYPERLWQWRDTEADRWVSDDPRVASEGMYFHADCLYRRHPHADLMLEWEKDQRENPAQVWQFTYATAKGWAEVYGTPGWLENSQYRRRKPNVRRIGEHEYPTPEVNAPLTNTVIYLPSPAWQTRAFGTVWKNSPIDHRRLNDGLVHLDEDAARAHAEAMIKGWTE